MVGTRWQLKYLCYTSSWKARVVPAASSSRALCWRSRLSLCLLPRRRSTKSASSLPRDVSACCSLATAHTPGCEHTVKKVSAWPEADEVQGRSHPSPADDHGDGDAVRDDGGSHDDAEAVAVVERPVVVLPEREHRGREYGCGSVSAFIRSIATTASP